MQASAHGEQGNEEGERVPQSHGQKTEYWVGSSRKLDHFQEAT